jgi:hypothetical protein
MIMKIKRSELRKVILEEISKSINEQEIDEAFGKTIRNAVLGAAAGLGAMAGTAKAANVEPQAWDSPESKEDYTIRITNQLLSTGKYDKFVDEFMKAPGEIGQFDKTDASNKLLRTLETTQGLKPGAFEEMAFQKAIEEYGKTRGGGASGGTVKKDAAGPKVQDAGDKYVVTIDVSHTQPGMQRDVAPGRAAAALGRYLGKSLADYKGASSVVINKDGTATVTLDKASVK